MPPRIRKRASKVLKENVCAENGVKNTKTSTKVLRKPLGDKTNSASDDNSLEVPAKVRKTTESVKTKAKENVGVKEDVRPRRERRIPTWFAENPVLTNLTNNKDKITAPAEDSGKTNVKHTNAANTKVPIVKLTSIPITKLSSITNVLPPNILSPKATNVSLKDTSTKTNDTGISPFKTPSKSDNSIVVSRPRRIHRLPSKFDNHLVSPLKYIPIQPGNASTPIQQSKSKPLTYSENIPKKPSPDVVSKKETPVASSKKETPVAVSKKVTPVASSKKETPVALSKKVTPVALSKKETPVAPQTRSTRAAARQKKVTANAPKEKSNPDSNNNKGKSTKAKKPKAKPLSPKILSPENSIRKFFNRTVSPKQAQAKTVSPKPTNKRVIDKSLSFKVLGGKKRSLDSAKNGDDDIYEFTFDPNEEPQPAKKKRKRPVTKKPTKTAKPKAVVAYKSVYDQNISKALSALKKAVKPGTTEPSKLPQIQDVSSESTEAEVVRQNKALRSKENKENQDPATNISSHSKHQEPLNDTGKTSECKYLSIRVEDIAADIEPSIGPCDDINYSPVNSPRISAVAYDSPRQSPMGIHSEDPLNLQEDAPLVDPPVIPARASKDPLNLQKDTSDHSKDPLNLQDDLSFFDDIPVASSSMNVSVRHPSATPWRVEFGNLPIKWPVNTYVKANMTPALESSFICSEESNKKKHVYTNMVPDDNESLPPIVTNQPTTTLKQTNLMSFIKEVAERKAKKKRGRSVSPTKAGTFPVSAKSKGIASSDAANRVFDEMNTAADAPVLRNRNVEANGTHIEEPTYNESESVHLFEDIEIVHHVKPIRKSYGKTKKVQFRQDSTSNSDNQEPIIHNDDDSSFEDDLGDLTFEVPTMKEKKKTKKKKSKKLMTKKEEKEADEWAAGFNSMCEEIEEFPLVVE